jgi:adenylate cyclase
MAADVVGYSRLVGQDEDGTLAAIRRLRAEVIEPKITEHHGRLFKTTGDGFLAEFPSVVNAVTCAVAVQQAMTSRNADAPEDCRVELRIGVHLGDVVAEGGDVYGDGVNVAARIEGLAPAGGVAVSAMVHDNIGSRLDLSYQDMSEQQLKNIARPVRVYRLETASRPTTQTSTMERTKPSIAVLPFTNMSGDAEQEYFSDGITEDIITELSRFRNLFVIARNSSFTYKGRAVDVKKVGKELGVAYVLEGSVRRAGNRVRITAQLIDADTGNHVWADRFDRELTDVFAVQDEITLKIVGMLTLGLEEDALTRAQRKPTESLAAYDYWLRGKRLLWTVGKNNLQARQNFENAARIDPKFSRAYSGLAVTYQMEALDFPLASEATKAYANAYEAAQQALTLDEADYQAHIALAWPLLYRNEYDRMKRHIDRAIDLNPNDADTLANATWLLMIYGEPERAIELGKSAMKLNPRYPDWYASFLAAALFTARRFPEA